MAAWLDTTLPNHNVTSNASTLTFEAINPGVAFTLSAAASSSLAPGTSVVTRPAAYFEISGTASNSTNAPTIHTYTLTSAGPGCLGAASGGVTGTIVINPITTAVFTGSNNPAGLDENPLLCDGSGAGGITELFSMHQMRSQLAWSPQHHLGSLQQKWGMML